MRTEINMEKLYWRIRGYDSLTEIFGMTVECGQFTTTKASASPHSQQKLPTVSRPRRRRERTCL